MTDARPTPPAGPPHRELVPFHRHAPGGSTALGIAAVLEANRDVTFGYLLGYLTLALHVTLEYTSFAGYFVGPWSEIEVAAADRPARGWRRSVARKGTYGPEETLGELVALISDGEAEPAETLGELGVPDDDRPPTRRVRARDRRPRVDLVVRPTDGHVEALHDFATEVGERFKRNLD